MNWYSVALTTLRCWPIPALLVFFEFVRRIGNMPWYTVPATIAAIATLAGVVLGYTLLEDWLRYESDEWQRRQNDC